MRMMTLALALAATTLTPTAKAQDWLDQMGQAVEQLTAPLQPPKTQPKAQGPVPPTRPSQPTVDVPVVAPVAPPVPRPRPEELDGNAAPVEEAKPVTEAAPASDAAPVATSEQSAAPQETRVYQGACPAVINGLVEASMLPPISEAGCGERSPLLVTAIESRGRMVSLSQPVTTNCAMASALPGWLETVDGYAGSMLGSRLKEVVAGTGYQCRARVGGDDALMSEHGFANALDITGFVLEDGRALSVTENWSTPDAPEGRLWRLAHDAACGSFTTVLGPEANAEHEDHLHLDLGCHGQSCTAQLCQ